MVVRMAQSGARCNITVMHRRKSTLIEKLVGLVREHFQVSRKVNYDLGSTGLQGH